MTEEIQDIEKKEIETAEDYEKQSEINDMRQHANKIIQGIKSLNSHDANRAIWELFQNAVDLSRDCHIEVGINKDSLQFSHNGIPFTPMTLDCLFKQVSSKTLEEKKETYTEEDPVGQYGTGFMTSHVFGRELIINGAIIKGKGYIPLENFVIDRRTGNWKVLANAIRDLKIEIASLLGKSYAPIAPPYPRTEFTYKFATTQNRESAQIAVDSLSRILPIVMAINPNLSSVKVTELDGEIMYYKKGRLHESDGVYVQEILINDDVRDICYIETEDQKTTIILPIDRAFNAYSLDKRLPRIFLYYPLIGTEDFGCNFIFHSRQFQPTEPRNALFLRSDNESNEKDEALNRLLIQNATLRIIQFLEENVGKISNRIHLATINFKVNSDDKFLNEYYSELKQFWIDAFKSLPLVEGAGASISALQAGFLDAEILSLKDGFDITYPLAERFCDNLPRRELINDWTIIVNEWDINDITYLRLDDIVKNIESESTLTRFVNIQELKEFYQFLLVNGKSDYFSEYKLLPNIYGEFQALMGNDGLRKSVNMTDDLIDIAEVLMPEVPRRHIDPEFCFNLDLPDYNRREYASDILKVITAIFNEKTLANDIDKDFFDKVIDFTKLSVKVNSTSIYAGMVRLICRFYDKSETLIPLTTVEDDNLERRQVHKYLVRVFLNDLSKEDPSWVEDNIEFLKEVLSLSGQEPYREMFEAIPVFPNKLFELCKQGALEVDDSIPADILDLYDHVIRPSMPIRAGLVHDEFVEYLSVKERRTVRNVTEQIESDFFSNNDLINLNSHPFKPEILNIVETFKTNFDYSGYYPLIFAQRSSILVSLADGEDSFAILSMPPSRINSLAILGNDPNFEQILSLGRAALLAEQHEYANFQHKYMLGRHIESILRKGLTEVLEDELQVDVNDEQNGQDIIVRIKSEPAFFIEVKSRWDKKNPIRMSKNQTMKAFYEKKRYALCSVDLTLFEGKDPLKATDLSEIENCIYFNLDIGDKVSHLVEVLDGIESAETINLDGDIRTRIPMKYVETGIPLTQFEKNLVEYIQALLDIEKQ